jgi:oxygen-dependent protoporphyrinogen oxidase
VSARVQRRLRDSIANETQRARTVDDEVGLFAEALERDRIECVGGNRNPGVNSGRLQQVVRLAGVAARKNQCDVLLFRELLDQAAACSSVGTKDSDSKPHQAEYSSMAMRIGIVGAGIAGLTAAHYLKRSGHTVTLFESSDRAGGRMTTDTLDGNVFDRGFQFFTSNYSTLLPLVAEAGLTSELRDLTPWNTVVRSQRMRNISIDRPLSAVTSGCLTPFELIRSVPGLLRILKETRRRPLDDYAAWASLDTETSTSFVREHFGKGFLDYILEPYLSGHFGQSTDETSRAFVSMLLGFARGGMKIMGLRPGVGAFISQLASYFDVRLRYPIHRVSVPAGGGVLLHSPMGDVNVDKAIIATTAPAAAAIYPNATAAEVELLRTPYSSTILVLTVADPGWRIPASLKKVWVIMTPDEGKPEISLIGLLKQKQQHGGASERLLITPSIDAVSRLWSLPDSEIAKHVLANTDRYLPGISAAARHTSVVRWKDALPKSPVGRSSAIQRYRETLDAAAPVVLAGDYLGFPHADSAAYTGKWAAEFLMKFQSVLAARKAAR